MIVGLGLALLMDQSLKGTSFFRNLFLLPFALSFVVTGTIWAWMFNPSNGILNSLLRLMHLDWLVGAWHTSQQTVMPSIMLALVWQFSGYVALIFLAGIKSVPQNIINAAKLDGASTWRVYRRLVFPQLKGAATNAITITAMFALRSFDFIWVLTGGGPGYASHTLPILMYKETFMNSRFTYGAAIGTILLILVVALIVPFTYKSHRRAQ
jgi:glucose/mannose transport system permease protein